MGPRPTFWLLGPLFLLAVGSVGIQLFSSILLWSDTWFINQDTETITWILSLASFKLYGSSIKKAKTIEKPSKVDFTGAAVPLSGTLKFGGAGPVGPLRAMINKRPGYFVYFIDQQTNQPTDTTCYRYARTHKLRQDTRQSSHRGLGRRSNAKTARNSQMWQTDQPTYRPI